MKKISSPVTRASLTRYGEDGDEVQTVPQYLLTFPVKSMQGLHAWKDNCQFQQKIRVPLVSEQNAALAKDTGSRISGV